MSRALNGVGSKKIAVIMGSLYGCSTDNESKQHQGQRARKCGAYQIQLVLQLSSHVLEQCVRVVIVI